MHCAILETAQEISWSHPFVMLNLTNVLRTFSSCLTIFLICIACCSKIDADAVQLAEVAAEGLKNRGALTSSSQRGQKRAYEDSNAYEYDSDDDDQLPKSGPTSAVCQEFYGFLVILSSPTQLVVIASCVKFELVLQKSLRRLFDCSCWPYRGARPSQRCRAGSSRG